MNVVEFISNWWKETLEYRERVLKNGGTTKREDVVQQYNQMCKSNGIFDSIKFAWLGEAGGKFRDSGANRFWTKAYSLVTPQAKYGPELITNQADREFTSDTRFWTKNAGVTIADGVCHFRNSPQFNGLRRSSAILTVGIRYKITYTIKNYINGTLRVYCGINGPDRSGNGTYSEYLTPTLTTLNFDQSTAGTGTFDIDNISVVEVLNSLDGSPTDATQTTSTSQPYITGNIAPTERIGMKNPNGGSSYMTHPTISFAANEAWSVTMCTNFNFSNNSLSYICRGISTNISLMYHNARLRFDNASGVVKTSSDNSLLPIIGKTSIITLIAKGNGVLSIFINGILLQNINITTNIELSQLLSSVGNAGYMGIVYSHIIRAQALTPSQVAAEANFLRSLYPEIPSVQIGTQTWATSNCEMVATPQGNLIANVTENANVEKITNGGFDTDTDWFKGVGWTISGGTANFDTTASSLIQSISGASASKYYKITFTLLNSISGALAIADNNGILSQVYLTNGTYTTYVKPTTPTAFFSFYAISGQFSIDNVSVQEVGWSDATNLYNYVYANTAGTVEQKTYAAVKAAAMWRYPNNDSALGAIYNKLYNDYAMKLLAMDIAYYNTANPTAPWGWDIPTEAEWTTLQTTVNNNAEALKKDGTVYWSSPNAGTNSSLFTALPAGYVKEDGTFSGLNTAAIFASKDNMDIPKVGKSIRLIKK